MWKHRTRLLAAISLKTSRLGCSLIREKISPTCKSLGVTARADAPCDVFHSLSPLWGHCRARPCSWSRGALEAPAGPAAGHWPSRPPCSCPARAYTAPPCQAFSRMPCRPVVPANHLPSPESRRPSPESRRPSPEWACGCRWTHLGLTARRTASPK